MKLDIESYLLSLAREKQVVFCPNPGNAGDSLIATATFQLFEKLGVSYRLYDEASFDPRNAVLVYGGGGNYSLSAKLLEQYHTQVEKLIVLPHTICGNSKLLERFGSNVDLIVREERSFDYVKRVGRNANVFISDDMAFKLNLSEVLSSKPFVSDQRFSLKRTIRRRKLFLREAFRRSFSRSLAIDCFRTDSERTEVKRPFWNADISKLFKCGTQTPSHAAKATRMMFSFLSHYEEIRTNRLHVAVAGALLGKTVRLYPNNYYKCEAVYNYSMKDRFPNVQWMGEKSG